ncbi:MAG: M18 family aminopeptidase, partial [Candidatus Electrothrix sp. AR3]|nr:M18 family aminopeptidase [Candidatus Electrothrix sp. AR3]
MLPQDQYLAALIAFICSSPTAFHATASAATLLKKNGFGQLEEQECWNSLPAGKYLVTRNDSSLIAFTWHGKGSAIQMIGAHTDSPGLRVKPNPLRKEQNCLLLGVEVYGGALLRPWFDRELSLAGRVCWQAEQGELCSALLDFKRPLGIIPNLAIHLNREANNKQEVNKQTDIVPIIGLSVEDDVDYQKILLSQLCLQHPGVAPLGII